MKDIIKYNDTYLFNLIKENKFNKLILLIKNNKFKNLNIKDASNNYFISYIVLYNKYNILKILLSKPNINIRLDIIDNDGRNILYNCIKYNYVKLCELLITYDLYNIGINIINLQDKNGMTSLHYCILYNNETILKLLLNKNASLSIQNNDGDNVLFYSVIHKNFNILTLLLSYVPLLDYLNKYNMILLQVLLLVSNNDLVKEVIKKTSNFNNKESIHGMTIIHQIAIYNDNNLFQLLQNYIHKIDINAIDTYGNTALHYLIIEKNIILLQKFIESFNDINFNIVNIDGNTCLHIIFIIYTSKHDIISNLNDSIFRYIMVNTNLNIQNNEGNTCLYYLTMYNMITEYSDILIKKYLNIKIKNNNNNKIILSDDLLNIVVDYYYHTIKYNKASIYWINICKNEDEINCRNNIRNQLLSSNNIPLESNYDVLLDLNIDNTKQLSTNNSLFYLGANIDILFGLILLKQSFIENRIGFLLIEPLYKQDCTDFNNIQIEWNYQQLIFPTYYDKLIYIYKNKYKYIIIPIGINISQGFHSNILFWDTTYNTIERFEPFGNIYLSSYNYNQVSLDNKLEEYFKNIDSNITYIPPSKFLPDINFQLLEIYETNKYKKLYDPEGFCNAWCIWWVYQRLLNINNKEITLYAIAHNLIDSIKMHNYKFKNIIREFTTNIVILRDKCLTSYNLDINDWINYNYNFEIFKNIEIYILNILYDNT